MAARELIVLGTAGQSPTIERSQSAYALRWNDRLFVFDPGENAQRQMMHAGLHITHVDRIFISHFHGDHCLGLPGLVQRRRLAGAPGPLHLHYGSFGRENVARLLYGSAVDFDLGIEHHPIEAGEVQATDDLEITALPLDHTVPTVGWRIQQPARRHLLADRLADLGIEHEDIGRLRDEGSIEHRGRTVTVEDVSEVREGASFAFVMDTRPCPNAAVLARDVDLLVAEATYSEEHADHAHRNGHMTAAQAAGLAAEAGAGRLVLSHFSERYRDGLAAFEEEASAVFPDVVVADDLDVIAFPD